LKKIGCDYTVLGKEIKNWNNLYKVDLISKYLEKTDSETILYLDSTDVLVVGDIDESILKKKKCKMLFNAELKFYPSCPSLEEEERFEKSVCENQYFALNAGCWMGEVSFVKKIIQDFFDLDLEIENHVEENKNKLEKIRITNSDQFRWHILYKKNFPEIQIDSRCELFQNIFMHSKTDFLLI
jgi:hypothetical protein